MFFFSLRLTTLEEQDGDLSQVEIDEVLCLVGHVTSEVPSDDAVPGGVVLLVELLLDEGRDVLLNVVLLKSCGAAKVGAEGGRSSRAYRVRKA